MIWKVSYIDILEDPNWPELQRQYSEECLVKDPVPQRATYETLEKLGLLHCFGALIDGKLVGFVSIIISVMPHHGKRMASIESIFVLPENRDSGVGLQLLAAAEGCAEHDGCDLIVYTTRIGSAMEKVMSRRSGCTPTHTMFTRWFK